MGWAGGLAGAVANEVADMADGSEAIVGAIEEAARLTAEAGRLAAEVDRLAAEIDRLRVAQAQARAARSAANKAANKAVQVRNALLRKEARAAKRGTNRRKYVEAKKEEDQREFRQILVSKFGGDPAKWPAKYGGRPTAPYQAPGEVAP